MPHTHINKCILFIDYLTYTLLKYGNYINTVIIALSVIFQFWIVTLPLLFLKPVSFFALDWWCWKTTTYSVWHYQKGTFPCRANGKTKKHFKDFINSLNYEGLTKSQNKVKTNLIQMTVTFISH